MGSEKGDTLRGEQSSLTALAETVRTLLDQPVEIAADRHLPPESRWRGPNAEKVRGDLGTRQRTLHTMADTLTAEAGSRGRDATAADRKPPGN